MASGASSAKYAKKPRRKKIYRKAKAAGKKASLVEQQRPNLFTNRVANINAGETVVVRLEYVQQLAFNNGEFSLRFPSHDHAALYAGRVDCATRGRGGSPRRWRSIPTSAGPNRPTRCRTLTRSRRCSTRRRAMSTAPLNPLEVTARLDMGMPLARVDAPYHDIMLARRAGVYSISLAAGVTEMDRDFVLTWQPVSGAAPTAALFTEEVGEEYFGLLMVLPPAAERAAPAPPRELIFVVDTSGSMGGTAIARLADSVSRALRELRPEDRFNIIEFNSTHRALYRRPVPATRHHVQRAQEFVRQLQATGGTEMLPALRAALATTAGSGRAGRAAGRCAR